MTSHETPANPSPSTDGAPVRPSPSAWQRASENADSLPHASELPPASLALAHAARALAAAVVMTDVDANTREQIAAQLNEIRTLLVSEARDEVAFLARHDNGRFENLTQAGSGRLNPSAPNLQFDDFEMPDTSNGPVPVELVGHCTIDVPHGGPPDRVHGGVVATLLDEAVGLACAVSGAPGLTAGLNVRYRAGTPLHQELVVTGRYTHSEGRKNFATAEIRVNGQVVAEAQAIMISANTR